MPYLKSIEFKGCPPPLEEGQLHFHDRVNVFIGPNAVGKSTLLRRIYQDYKGPDVFLESRATDYLRLSDDWPEWSSDTSRWKSGFDCKRGVPLTYMPATRIHLPVQLPVQPLRTPVEIDSEDPMDIVERFIDDSSDIFHGEHVEDMIRIQASGQSANGIQVRALSESLHVAYTCAKEICGEVIYGRTFQSYSNMSSDNLYQGSEAVVRPSMGVVTTDRVLGEPLYAGALSAGTQGTLLWIWALALRIWFDDGRDLESRNHLGPSAEQPAILLIDEIENHLHPTWQRRVIPALLKHFPGLQIFATTHSPFVVAGLKAGQVHLLKRDEHGSVTATTSTEDIVGWTADEILRTMMGVDDPTDDATASAARELRQLRSEGPYSNEDDEADRQQRIQELRQKVDRDLLAGGPMAARRQRFEEQFSKTLEEYRRSRDLNQDNG